MSGPANVQKIRSACNKYPILAGMLVGKEQLLKLCDEVERYRGENQDLQRYALALMRALDDEVKPDVTH
ncbi:hypothetical protein LCGC14_1131740 [marine sediment metagenome]|uniref:Uncharacterized protein n=1 Tax=marine sediment metagenome TaxID=412755 RepID=A0A0F9PJ49_9ZZZZ